MIGKETSLMKLLRGAIVIDKNDSFSDEFKVLVDNAAEGVVIIQDDLMVYFNNAALNISGYPAEIYAKTHISKILDPDDSVQMIDPPQTPPQW